MKLLAHQRTRHEIDMDNVITLRPNQNPLRFVDQELFARYVREFPCLKGAFLALDNLQEFRNQISQATDDEAAAKELALDCILELLSGGDFEITWKDIFDIFGKDDQDAFIRIMTQHSRHIA